MQRQHPDCAAPSVNVTQRSGHVRYGSRSVEGGLNQRRVQAASAANWTSQEATMATNPNSLSGLPRRLVEYGLLHEPTAGQVFEEDTKTRVPFLTHLVQNGYRIASAITNAASAAENAS